MEIVRSIVVIESFIFGQYPSKDELIALRASGFEYRAGQWKRTTSELQELKHDQFMMRIGVERLPK